MSTKVNFNQIKGAPINLLDYSGLVVARTAALRGVDPTGWLGVAYDDWWPAFWAARAALIAQGGGTFVVPYSTSPYIVSDVVLIPDNVHFICEGLIKLANSTTDGSGTPGTGGGMFGVGAGTYTENLLLDGSGIYTGTSGENGVGFGGQNVVLVGGKLINFARGGGATGDGGKAISCETTMGDARVSDISIENCFQAINTQRSLAPSVHTLGPQIFTGITAKDCAILLFVAQPNAPTSITGQDHSLMLSDFVAVDCGNGSEGIMQFSSASNVYVENGLITNVGFTAAALIRGRTEYSSFKNIQMIGDLTALISNVPGTYNPGTGPSQYNSYDIVHRGAVATAVGSSAAANKAIINSSIKINFDTEPSSGLIDADAGSTTTHCELVKDAQVLRGTSKYIATNLASFTAATWNGDVLANSETGVWTPALAPSATPGTFTPGAVSGTYTRQGRQVTLNFSAVITTNNTGSVAILISGVPAHLPLPADALGYGYTSAAGGSKMMFLSKNADAVIAALLYDGNYPGADATTLYGKFVYELALET